MIRKENLEEMIESIGYTQSTRAKVYVKKFAQFNAPLQLILTVAVPLIIQKIKE